MLVKAPSSNHIRTYTGGWINPVDPDPKDINIADIAHALANQCRFTGHVQRFYSVAEHSVRVAEYCLEKSGVLQAWNGLLHDASEAYISDLARPVKRNPAISGVYNAIEDNLMQVLAVKFDFTWPITELVAYADNVLLRTEQRDLMLGSTYEGELLDADLSEPWAPVQAEDAFLIMYQDLTEELS